MTTKAQRRASRAYEARNRNRTRYNTVKRNARNFITPKKGSVTEEAIKDFGAPFYVDDLKDFQLAIKQRLEELDK